jgi:hypothetical protein
MVMNIGVRLNRWREVNDRWGNVLVNKDPEFEA